VVRVAALVPALVPALVTALVTALALAACDQSAPPGADPSTDPSRPSSAPAATSAVPQPVDDPLVVVGHATRPQLDLTAAEVADHLARAGDGDVVTTVAEVESDPGAVGVVPLGEVGPTVVVATVDGVDPVRDAPGATRLTVVGDLMLVRGVTDAATALRPMRRLLRAADLTVGNLESTLSLRGEPTQGGDSFGGTPELLGPLRSAGFDALSLANNHAGDYGRTALLDTVRTLRRSPVTPFGAGRDVGVAAGPAVLEADGTTFAFLGFNAIGETPAAAPGSAGALSVRMPPRTGPLVPADLARVTRAVRRAERTADVVVVLPHWGTQYVHEPEPVQRRVSRALVRAGADLVVGGHPHWVQGVDSVDNGASAVPVLHSLGNFVFDMGPPRFTEEAREGVVLEATFWGAELKAVRLVPYRMDPEAFAPRVLRGRDARAVLADVWGTSTGPYAAGS
jgi:poly-gamma-glutamate capsule biosynthesis protein CapA/YwtB (metallophosphatase superfamily)